MAASTHEAQGVGEGRQAIATERAVPTESPELIRRAEMSWGAAPDAFPAGCELCVLHGDPGAQGAMFSVRLRTSEEYVFAPHCHPHDEHVTVISGRLHLGNGRTLDRAGARLLEPGDYAFLPKEQYHYAWSAADDTVIQVEAIGPFAITYANPADDPRHASAAH